MILSKNELTSEQQLHEFKQKYYKTIKQLKDLSFPKVHSKFYNKITLNGEEILLPIDGENIFFICQSCFKEYMLENGEFEDLLQNGEKVNGCMVCNECQE